MRKIINRLLFALTSRLPTRLIKLDDKPYLERYYLGQLFGVTFYLHRFVSGDSERHLHNHPWHWARSIILSGSYKEEYVIDLTAATESGCVTKYRRVKWYNRINGNHFHRITKTERGTWTLFFHSERAMIRCGSVSKPKHWGFLQHGYHIGAHDSVMFVPWPTVSGEWWKNAPAGRDSGRVWVNYTPRKKVA